MNSRNAIIRLIEQGKTAAAPVTEESDLYSDLGYDSLAFVELILRVEETFLVSFELTETGECVKAGRLIELTEKKLKENGK